MGGQLGVIGSEPRSSMPDPFRAQAENDPKCLECGPGQFQP